MIGPIPSAMDAIAQYFNTISDNIEARRGWPEDWQELSLQSDNNAVLTTTPAGNADASRCNPKVLSKVWVNNELVTTYRVAWLSIGFQLDLFCPFRATRDDLAAIVENNLSNALPHTSDLHIMTSDYHGRPLKITFDGSMVMDSYQKASEGLWRKTWLGTALTDLVITTTHPKLTLLNLTTLTTLDGITITEA